MQVSIDCRGGEDLAILRGAIRDGIGVFFEARLVVAGGLIPLDAMLGREARVTLEEEGAFGLVGRARTLRGLVRAVERIATVDRDGASHYALTVVPRAWLLTQRRSYRIFQHLPLPVILGEVLRAAGLDALFRLDPSVQPILPCRVQYGESDHEFISRLCEEAGLSFATEDTDANVDRIVFDDGLGRSPATESLHFVDNPSAVAPGAAWAGDVRQSSSLYAQRLVVTAFDMYRGESCRRHDVGDDERMVTHLHDSGLGLSDVDGAGTRLPVGDHRGMTRHDDGLAEARAERLLAAAKLDAHRVSLTTNCLDITPGCVFEIAGHPSTDLEEALLAVETTLDLVEGQAGLRVSAVRAGVAYRLPPRTRKARVVGLQCATVAGSEPNKPSCDELGRICVRFAWALDADERGACSAWLRLAQPWGGRGAGALAIPRAGQEVLVGFLEGDPDQPVVVGVLSNPLHAPPYGLPAHGARTTLRTESLAGQGFNELTFDDTAGKEQIYLRAEGALRRETKRREDVVVGGDRRTLVFGDQHTVVEGEQRLRLGAAHAIIDGDDRTRIDGHRSLTIAGSAHAHVGDIAAIDVERLHLRVNDDLVVDANDITLRVGGNFIRIGRDKITILATQVDINSGGEAATCEDAEPDEPEVAERVTPEAFDLTFWES